MHIRKEANIIKRNSKIRDQTIYGDVKDDYVRKILNHTTKAIRVVDASGRSKVHDPIPRPMYDVPTNRVIIEEWFAGIDIEDMVDVPKDIVNSLPYLLDQGVLIQHAVDLEDLQEMLDGIYLEEVGLHISLAEYNCKAGHPRFSTDMKTKLDSMSGTVIAIELLDPRCCTGTMYANIGGVVHTVLPKRFPTPSDEGILIHIKSSTSGSIITYAYDTEELLNGSGKHGIRLYLTELEAEEDIREPNKEGLVKLQNELRKRKEAIFNEGRQSAIDDARNAAESVHKSADEKLKKAEEALAAARAAKLNDRTNLVINLLKVGGAGLGLYKLIQLQK